MAMEEVGPRRRLPQSSIPMHYALMSVQVQIIRYGMVCLSAATDHRGPMAGWSNRLMVLGNLQSALSRLITLS